MDTNVQRLKPVERLSTWLPSSHSDVVGNKKLKKRLAGILKAIRAAVRSSSRGFPLPPFLISGLSRSGKSSTIKLLLRCMCCRAYNDSTDSPCNRTCETCTNRVEVNGESYLNSFLRMIIDGHILSLHYLPIDCSRLNTRSEVEKILREIKNDYDGIVVVFLDEAHRLKSRQLDEMFLKPIEDFENVWWIFGTARPEELDGMLRNRLTEIKTELPDIEELATWLIRRCQEFDLPYEEKAIIRVCEKSNRVPGIALKALEMASSNEGGVTVDFVEHDWDPPSYT